MADPVTIAVPKRPFFVGSYAFLRVDIDPASGIVFDDLAFSVPDGRRAGKISPSRDVRFNEKRPTITLLVGYEPGDWVILVTQISTGQDIAKFEYHVTDRWRGKRRGPRLWFDGQNMRQESGRPGAAGQRGRRISTWPLHGHAADRGAVRRDGIAGLSDRRGAGHDPRPLDG